MTGEYEKKLLTKRDVFLKETGTRQALKIVLVGAEEDNMLVTEILPRKNWFIRPFVANVDCFVIVAAARRPSS